MEPIRFHRRAETHSMHNPNFASFDEHQPQHVDSAGNLRRPVVVVGKSSR